tara:strand:- start:2373 stop:3140 length:768 start_codon:yes stop_codon:yes gene_type:complete
MPQWTFPIKSEDLTNQERLTSEYGVFGHKRSYYYHQGIDIYVTGKSRVFAAEDGIVVAIEDFTGGPGEEHWLYTQAVLVEGASGVLNYGEVKPVRGLEVGSYLRRGMHLANVSPVLPPEKARPDIMGHSTHMLHFEWYETGTRESVRWNHEDPYPSNLKDPTVPLTSAWELRNSVELDKTLTVREFLAWRGVVTPCPSCAGMGTMLYGSTSTWRGGLGGAAMTYDVCRVCWGTGDANRKGTDLEKVTELLESTKG